MAGLQKALSRNSVLIRLMAKTGAPAHSSPPAKVQTAHPVSIRCPNQVQRTWAEESGLVEVQAACRAVARAAIVMRAATIALAIALACLALSVAAHAQQQQSPPTVAVSTNATGNTPLSNSAVSISTSGANTIVTGRGTQVVRVYRIVLVAAGAVTVTAQDGATPLTGAMTMTAGVPLILDFTTQPWFTTSPGNAFVISLSTGVQVSGTLFFTQG